MPPYVIDDALLYAVLAGRREQAVDPYVEAADRGDVFTTSSWYWRLTRALAHPGRGSLSRAFSALDDARRGAVWAQVIGLPQTIRMLSPRTLIPVMAALPGQLNMLTAEAVAAAMVANGALAAATESDLLIRTAAVAGVAVEIVQLAR
jgi:hypothetical protein